MEELFLENYALVDKFDHLPDGMFAMCYPGDFPNGRFIPNWAMWLVFEVEEFKNRGGNPKLVEKFRPKLESLVEYMRRFRNSDGLLEKLPSWVFIEWSQANYLVQDVNYPSNMAWAEVLDAMDRLYAKPELRAEAQKMRQTIRRQSWTGKWFCDNAVRQKDGTLKLSGDSTETCQYYAFYFKTATPKTHPELWKTLVSDFGPSRIKTKKHKEIFPSNAFIGNYLRLECLAREGLTDKILDETKDFFLYMAERTGTLWENINISASCNHGFASHIAVTFARDIVGLKEVDYCAKKVKFTSPENIPVKNVSVKIPLDDGTYIEAGWSREGSKVLEKLKLPDGWSRICEGSKNNNDLQAD
jgi:alpha-L-rhamnosidase